MPEIIAGNIIMQMVAFFMTIFVLVMFLAIVKMRNCLDRYRLKYGFDLELEGKEWGKDPDKLAQRKRYFEKRTFRD